MPDYSVSAYSTAPRGLASNTGFEDEDARLAARLAQNALNSAYFEAIDKLAVVASMLWQQNKYRGLCNEIDFLERVRADFDMVAREYAIDGALPELPPAKRT